MVRSARLNTLILGSVVLLGSLPSLCRAAEASADVDVTRDVSYYDGQDADPVRHKLDLYRPRGKKQFPVMVLVHGGAWVCGDKTFFGRGDDLGHGFARQGVGVVMPNYRLAPGAGYVDQARDLARVLAWTARNIAKYGGAPDQVFLGGHSAGGHLATLIATDEKYLKAEGVQLSFIKGVIGVSGVYRLPEINLSLSLPGEGEKSGLAGFQLRINPFGVLLAADEKSRRDASPLLHVRTGLPPFLLIYAENDLPLLPQMAQEFARALKDSRCTVETLAVDRRDHESVMFEAKTADDPVARAVVQFISSHSAPPVRR